MSSKRLSRRTALSAGGVLVGLGVVGVPVVEFASEDDRTPGADGFTAKTAPAGSDPLVLVDVDGMEGNGTAEAATRTLLGAKRFGDLPDGLVGAFESGPQSATVSDGVGKLVFVGSGAVEDGSAAVVWADWTDDELVGVLESEGGTTTEVGSYREQTLYTSGGTSATVLGDTEFALGTPEVVRDVVDVWHGGADPVGGKTLDSLERTPRRAHVRFSFEELRLPCANGVTSRSDAYRSITQLYGSVPAAGDAVRLHLRVASNGATGEVAAAVRDDIASTGGNGDHPESGAAGLPRVVRDGVTVGHEHDFVTVEYSAETGETADSVGEVIETTVCLVGGSG